MSGEHDGPYRRRRIIKVDVVWLYSGLRKTQVQIVSRANSCSFHLSRLQKSQVVRGSKRYFFYSGLGSWFHLTPGKDMFRDARCPVDACTITLDQTQTADADAFVYHSMFAHPGHPRPPKHVQALKYLCSQGCTKGRDRVASPDSSF
jgi:hypothetical protein